MVKYFGKDHPIRVGLDIKPSLVDNVLSFWPFSKWWVLFGLPAVIGENNEKSELIISYFAFVQYVAKYMYSFPLYLFLVGILYITIKSLGGSKGQNERTRTKHCSHRMRPRGRLLDWANSGKSDHDCGILLCHSKLWVRDCKCYVLQCVNKTIYGFIEDYSPI